MQIIDTSHELQISRYANGIKLIRPRPNHKSELTIANVLKLPFAVYLNSDHNIVNCNEICAELSGFVSARDSIGKKWFKCYEPSTIKPSLINEQDVIKNNKYKIIDDILIRKDSTNVHALSIKMPWYNDKDKIIGLFGYSVFLGRHSLSESLSLMSKLGLLFSNQTMSSVEIYFSPREKEILYHVVRGKTAKEIGDILAISNRTVEHYIESAKGKTQSANKSELIDKVFALFQYQ